MTRNLFRVTVDEPNYSRLLESVPSLQNVDGVPESLKQQEAVRLWGVRSGSRNEKFYDQLEQDDGLVFYKGGKYRAGEEGLYVGLGTVGEKIRVDSDTAYKLFRNPKATRVYTVENFVPISASRSKVEGLLDYEGYPQGPHRVTNNRYTTVDDFMQELQN